MFTMHCYNCYNFFFGFLSQIIPCALLCILPIRQSWKSRGKSKKGGILVVALTLLSFDILFTILSTYITWHALYKHTFSDITANHLINFLFVLIIIIFFLIYSFAIPVDFKRKTFLFLFAFEYGMLIAIFSIIFSSFFPEKNILLQNIPYSTNTVIFLIVVNAVLLPIFSRVLTQLYRVAERVEDGKSLLPNLFFLIPLPFIICTLICSIMPNASLLMNPLFILLLISLLMAQIVIYWFLANYVSFSIQSAEQERQYQLTLENYKTLSRNLESLRIFRHEFNRHMLTLSSYLEHDQTDTALEYIHSLQDTPSLSTPLFFCRHPLINSLLSFFLPDMKEAGVELEYQIQLPDELPLPDDHMIGILYNMLQNASEACTRILNDETFTDRPFLHLNIFVRQEHLVIICCNSENKPLRRNSSGQIISTKQDSQRHGYGLKIINDIAHMHNGIVEQTEKTGKFEISVAIHLDFPEK